MDRSKKIYFAILFWAFFISLPSIADATTFETAETALLNKTYDVALRDFRVLADKGHPIAQSRLGYMYKKGLGVRQSYKSAAKWYQKAAKQGRAEAQVNLGFLYSIGIGLPEDYAMAAKWYRKAAVQGHGVAQYNLGLLYENGDGVPKNNTTALMWVTIAVSKGARFARPHQIRLEKKLSDLEISKAMARADHCIRSHYSSCD